MSSMVLSMREPLSNPRDHGIRTELWEVLSQAMRNGTRHFVLDLSEVAYLDSAALSLCVGLLRQAREGGGTVCVAGASPLVRRTFEVTCLSRLFGIAETIPEALKGLRPS